MTAATRPSSRPGPDHAARPHHEVGRRTHRGGRHGDHRRRCPRGRLPLRHDPFVRDRRADRRTARDLRAGGGRHAAGIAALRPGISARELDTCAGRRSTSAGCLDWYLHGTGHGVGLEIHESPFHSQASDEVIIAGNVVTVEPGLYRVGFGGFRIEDLLVVTETGSQPLTHTVPRPISGLNARAEHEPEHPKDKDTTCRRSP